MELVDRLIERYGYNEPVMTEEIIATWNEYSRSRVFQLLREYTNKGLISKFDMSVYYIPRMTTLGSLSTLNPEKVIAKKYVRANNEVFGYYAGLNLLNGLYLTTQVPSTYEIVSSKASAIVRRINVGKSRVKLRKARLPITKDNVNALMLLEAFCEMGRPLDEDELFGVQEFVRVKDIKEKDVFKYASCFPAIAIKSLIGTGVENVFASR